VLDAWRGAATWAGKKESRRNFITKAEYAEKGSEYIKEHDLGNAASA
jgi:actin-related protein 5